MSAPLVLASASPRRRELLARLHPQFTVLPSDIPEEPRDGEPATTFARRVARDKAVATARLRPDAIVLAGDTIVVKDGEIFGKPRDRAHARSMLQSLAAATHQVMTAVALLAPEQPIVERLVVSEVRMRQISPDEIESYLDSPEPWDKAGAYALQGQAGSFVTSVVGSQSNVIGLPLLEVAELLRPHLAVGEVEDLVLR